MSLIIGDCLVSDADHAAIKQRSCQLARRGEMQVSEQYQSLAQESVFGSNGFLYLDDHFGARPYLFGRTDDLGAGGPVFLIDDTGAVAGLGLDQHFAAAI